MIDEIAPQALSLGITGLLFVMWWYERQERTRSSSSAKEVSRNMSCVSDVNDHLLDVIRANTEALTSLREELRSYRYSETEWRNRIAAQLERLTAE